MAGGGPSLAWEIDGHDLSDPCQACRSDNSCWYRIPRTVRELHLWIKMRVHFGRKQFRKCKHICSIQQWIDWIPKTRQVSVAVATIICGRKLAASIPGRNTDYPEQCFFFPVDFSVPSGKVLDITSTRLRLLPSKWSTSNSSFIFYQPSFHRRHSVRYRRRPKIKETQHS